MAQSLERGDIVFASFRNIIVALAILNACALLYMETSDIDEIMFMFLMLSFIGLFVWLFISLL